jgi:hypothetical protein
VKDGNHPAFSCLAEFRQECSLGTWLTRIVMNEALGQAQLGLRTETVKTRLHRARRLLREALERRTGPVLVNAFPFDGWRCERMTQAVLHGLGMVR